MSFKYSVRYFRNFLIALTVVAPQFAAAADVAQLQGKWATEKAANGNRMVFEFTPDSVATYALDASGKRLGDVAQPKQVRYKDLGETIGVEFQDGSGINAAIKDTKTIVLILPGMGTRELTRLAP